METNASDEKLEGDLENLSSMAATITATIQNSVHNVREVTYMQFLVARSL